jgi:hypothetical protein
VVFLDDFYTFAMDYKRMFGAASAKKKESDEAGAPKKGSDANANVVSGAAEQGQSARKRVDSLERTDSIGDLSVYSKYFSVADESLIGMTSDGGKRLFSQRSSGDEEDRATDACTSVRGRIKDPAKRGRSRPPTTGQYVGLAKAKAGSAGSPEGGRAPQCRGRARGGGEEIGKPTSPAARKGAEANSGEETKVGDRGYGLGLR